jgi:hypothetical protein
MKRRPRFYSEEERNRFSLRMKTMWERRKQSNWVSHRTGTTHSEETKLKMRQAWERRRERGWKYIPTPEHLLKAAIRGREMVGVPLPEATKLKIQESLRRRKELGLKNKPFSPEYLERMRSPENIERMRETSRKLYQKSVENNNVYLTFKGRHHTEETKQRLRLLNLGKKPSPQTLKKIKKTKREKMKLKMIEMKKLGYIRTSYGYWKKIEKKNKLKPVAVKPVKKKVTPPKPVKVKTAVKKIAPPKPVKVKKVVELNNIKWMDTERIMSKIKQLRHNR